MRLAGLAQMVEQLFCKHQVTGSIPVAGTTLPVQHALCVTAPAAPTAGVSVVTTETYFDDLSAYTHSS